MKQTQRHADWFRSLGLLCAALLFFGCDTADLSAEDAIVPTDPVQTLTDGPGTPGDLPAHGDSSGAATPTPTPTNPGSSPSPSPSATPPGSTPPPTSTPPIVSTPTPSPTPQEPASGAGKGFTLQVAELDQQAYTQTIYAPTGYLFKAGDLSEGAVYAEEPSSGANFPVQLDVLRRHTDNSVRHALVTVALPSIGAAQVRNLVLKPGAGPALSGSFGHSFDPAALDAEIILVREGQSYRHRLRDALSDPAECVPNSASGKASSNWRIYGDLVRQCVAWDVLRNPNGSLNPHVDISWRLTFYRNRDVKVSVVVENTHINALGNTFANYPFESAQLRFGSNVIWSMGPVNLAIGTRFTTPVEYSYGSSPNPVLGVRPDHDYFVRSVGVFPAFRGIVNAVSELNKYDVAPYTVEPGEVTKMAPLPMHQTGGGNHIGAFRTDERIYLNSYGREAYRYMAGVTANHLGNLYSVHFRQSALSQSQTPGGAPGIACGGWLAQAPTVASTALGEPDTAHQPSKGFVDYAMNPLNLMALEELQFWMRWGLASAPSNDCVIDTQIRSVAWSIRDIARAAWITPDGDPLQSYFTQQADKAIARVRYYTVNSGLPAGFYNPLTYDSGGLVNSGQLDEVNTVRTARWQTAWVFWALVNARKMGFTAATEAAQWIGNDILLQFTATDDPAHQYLAPNGVTYTWDWRWAFTYTSPAYYYPQSLPNSIPCDALASTAPFLNSWTKTPVINFGQRQYLHDVQLLFAGWPLPKWCPTNANGSPMTVWDPQQMPWPSKVDNSGPGWMKYGGEIAIMGIQELAFDLSSTWISGTPSPSLSAVQSKVFNQVVPRYQTYTVGQNQPLDLVYAPLFP